MDEPDDELGLFLPHGFSIADPLAYGAAMQLVFSWGGRVGPKPLRLYFDRVSSGQAGLSDHSIVAIFHADHVIDEHGTNITVEARRMATEALRDHRAIQPRSSGVRAPSTQSIIYVRGVSSPSPDLVADSSGAIGEVDDAARSLYGWVWPTDDQERLVPAIEQNERLVGKGADEHIERCEWPQTHPYREAGGKSPFSPLADRMVRFHSSSRSRLAEIPGHARPEDHLGTVLYELVQNIHVHGSVDRTKKRLEMPVSIVRTETRSFDSDGIKRAADDRPQLARWLRSHLDRSPHQRVEIAFVSVVDNGIGLAQRAASLLGYFDTVAHSDELDFLQAALSESVRVSVQRMSARGLQHVQSMMTDFEGFMVISSGRVDLVRDFVEKPFAHSRSQLTTRRKDLFIDWLPTDESPEYPLRRGTVITLAIPTR